MTHATLERTSSTKNNVGLIEPTEIEPTESGTPANHSGLSEPSPLLKEIVAAIREDARRDSLLYALRSNVGHDGE